MHRKGVGSNVGRDYVLLPDHDDSDAESGSEPSNRHATPAKLVSLAKEETLLLAAATVVLLLASVFQVAIPKLAGDLIDVAVKKQGGESSEGLYHDANVILLQIIVIVVVSGVASGLRAYLFESAAERVMFRLRVRVHVRSHACILKLAQRYTRPAWLSLFIQVRLFQSLLGQEIGFFDRVRVGELMNRLSEDTRLMKSVATVSVSMALRAFASSILGLVMMCVRGQAGG
jgi:ABC-type multidrug transport system fused ATPase/permease subunit